MMSRLRKLAPFLLSLSLFILAIWAISQEFKHYTFADLLDSLARISTANKLGSIFLTVLGYLSMTGYDWLGFRYINHPLALPKIIRTSFISYAIGNTVGFTIFSGTAIRYRFYSPAGVGKFDIAKVITFTHLSFWLGMLTIGGVGFLTDPLAVPQLLRLPFATAKPLGVIFLFIVGLYFILTIIYKKPIKIANREVTIPSLPISIALIFVSCLDWILAAGVLYVLLPDSYNMSFFGFFGIYIFALTIGIISNVPGGLGVFEFIMLKLRPSSISEPDLLGALIAYRGVYHFLPLIVAFVLLIGYEIQRKARN